LLDRQKKERAEHEEDAGESEANPTYQDMENKLLGGKNKKKQTKKFKRNK
jgi:hypothetical protein